ncbi:MAG: hypothetical protein ABIJ44_09230 [Pseudomonadota bacterium]
MEVEDRRHLEGEEVWAVVVALVPGETASVPIAVKRPHMNVGHPVLRSNAPNAERL